MTCQLQNGLIFLTTKQRLELPGSTGHFQHLQRSLDAEFQPHLASLKVLLRDGWMRDASCCHRSELSLFFKQKVTPSSPPPFHSHFFSLCLLLLSSAANLSSLPEYANDTRCIQQASFWAFLSNFSVRTVMLKGLCPSNGNRQTRDVLCLELWKIIASRSRKRSCLTCLYTSGTLMLSE